MTQYSMLQTSFQLLHIYTQHILKVSSAFGFCHAVTTLVEARISRAKSEHSLGMLDACTVTVVHFLVAGSHVTTQTSTCRIQPLPTLTGKFCKLYLLGVISQFSVRNYSLIQFHSLPLSLGRTCCFCEAVFPVSRLYCLQNGHFINMQLVASSSPAFHCSTERKMEDSQGCSGGRGTEGDFF